MVKVVTRAVHKLAHQRHIEAGVDTTREKHAERHVGDHAPPHRLAQKPRQLRRRPRRGSDHRGTRGPRAGQGVPPAPGHGPTVDVDADHAAGRDLEDTPEHGKRRRRHDEREVMPERGQVHLRADAGVPQQGPNLRSEEPLTVGRRVR